MPRPYVKAIKLVLLAGGVVDDGFVTGRPGNPRCNGQEVRCLSKVKGPEREATILQKLSFVAFSAPVNREWEKLSA